MHGSSLCLEGESHRLFCRVFLDETLSHFCWEDDDMRSNALPLEFIRDIVVTEELSTDSDDQPLPVFALILSNKQVLKVICPNSVEFQLWLRGMQRLLASSGISNDDNSAADESSTDSRLDSVRASNQPSGRQQSSRSSDYDAAALAPYDYAEDNEE